jgi:hypothetical protein
MQKKLLFRLDKELFNEYKIYCIKNNVSMTTDLTNYVKKVLKTK